MLLRHFMVRFSPTDQHKNDRYHLWRRNITVPPPTVQDTWRQSHCSCFSFFVLFIECSSSTLTRMPIRRRQNILSHVLIRIWHEYEIYPTLGKRGARYITLRHFQSDGAFFNKRSFFSPYSLTAVYDIKTLGRKFVLELWTNRFIERTMQSNLQGEFWGGTFERLIV